MSLWRKLANAFHHGKWTDCDHWFPKNGRREAHSAWVKLDNFGNIKCLKCGAYKDGKITVDQ
jgi:hypothetical protein